MINMTLAASSQGESIINELGISECPRPGSSPRDGHQRGFFCIRLHKLQTNPVIAPPHHAQLKSRCS
jgi:hypothetical protein